MTVWQKPSFEELTMNAEIGAYSPEDWDDRSDEAPRASTEAAVVRRSAVHDG